MADFDNTNRGAFFKNDKKTKETQPDYSGTLNVEGKEYRIAGWLKEPKSGGAKFLSLSVEPKEGAPF